VKNLLILGFLCSVLTACGSSNPITAAQEESSLQGSWSGNGAGVPGSPEYSGAATFTVNGSTGTLSITGACPVTFTVPLTMQPGTALTSSRFHADGIIPENGYSLSDLDGSFVSSTQVTVSVPFQTPCLAEAVDVQFTLTK
jgi:hypothetical protein